MPETAPSPIYALADAYVSRYAALNPIAATEMGVAGHDAEMTDYSPDGIAARAALDRETLRALGAAPLSGERDRVARDVMAERLNLQAEWLAAQEPLRDLNIIASPLQAIRQAFDLMPRATAEEWRNIAARLQHVALGLRGYRASLETGMARGVVAARRQALEGAQQARTWAGGGGGGFFASLLVTYDASGVGNAALRGDLEDAAAQAAAGYAEFGAWLRDGYAPHAVPVDAVGVERYGLAARAFTGTTLDLDETYAWGWDEVRRLQREMAETAARIAPGVGVAGAMALLDTDPARSIEGAEPFRQWMQDLQNRTIAELQGVHFDIPQPVQRLEARIAPPGGALAMYYTGPSEDFSRPGRTWYPTGGQTRFPLWREVSVAYHEGVPGHHLQIAQVVYLRDTLSRYQRLMAGTSGYAEGWALYAERLMSELGYLEQPDAYLGYLSSQALRAARVVVDIGLHLSLSIPLNVATYGGERWTPAIAHAFLRDQSGFPEAMLASEVSRYLGWPGQAISYKVGERSWLAARERARAAAGASFGLKGFHARALSLGPMGLAQLERDLAASP